MNVRVLNHGGELWLNIEEAMDEIRRNRELAEETLAFLKVWHEQPVPREHDHVFVMQVMAANYLATLARIELPKQTPPATGA